MFDYHPVDLVVVDQLEQLAEPWPVLGHAGAHVFQHGDQLVALADAVGRDPTDLTFQIALGFLVVAAHPAVDGDTDLGISTIIGDTLAL